MNTADQNADDTDEMQRLAYAYWEKRGRPLGSPEDDWFPAKEQLEPRAARAHTLMRYSLKMVSGLVGFIGKALPLILGRLMCNQCALTGLQHTSVGPQYPIPHGGYT
jgi:hypothetical protein